jgi:hypothetical protein
MKVGDKMLCIKTKIINSEAYSYAKIVKDRYYVVSGVSSSLIYVQNGNYTASFRTETFYEYFASDSYIRKLKLDKINESKS